MRLKLKMIPNRITFMDVTQDELDRFLADISDETKNALLIKSASKRLQLWIEKSHLEDFEVIDQKQ